MIRLTLSAFFVGLLITIVHAQQTAMWEMTVYVEDAVGNRDSVVIGKDTLASNTEVNTQFGEEDISHVPWDSVFEVRAANLVDVQFGDELETPFFQSKKVISRLPSVFVYDDCIITAQSPPLVIRAIHLPITISWDSTKYDNPCLIRSFMSTHRFPSIADSWMVEPYLEDETQCMRSAGLMTTRLPYLPQFSPGFGLMAKIVDMEGGSRDTVKGVFIYSKANGFSNTPCEHVWITDVDDVHTEGSSDLFLYPNPTTAILRADAGGAHIDSYMIYDIQGRVHQHANWRSEIDVSQLQSGMYLIELVSGTGEKWHQKFYKQ